MAPSPAFPEGCSAALSLTFDVDAETDPTGVSVSLDGIGRALAPLRRGRFDQRYLIRILPNRRHLHITLTVGDDIVVDGTGSVPYWGSVFSTRLDGLDKHGGAPSVYGQRTRPCPGIEFLSSPHFPAEFQGNLLVGNVIGFQGILQYKLENRDSSLGASEVEPIVYSSDPNFRPADLEVAPDGSIYFTDWQNPIIGHMQHNLRDTSRDHQHGRISRVTAIGRPLLTPAKIAGQPPAPAIVFADPAAKALMIRCMLTRGFMVSSQLYVMFVHDEATIDALLAHLAEVFAELSVLSTSGRLREEAGELQPHTAFARLA
mgnify:CR=1 FL=1